MAMEGAQQEPPEARLLDRLREKLLHPRIRERVLVPIGFDASILLLNLVTGVAIARALGPSGRGEIAAILMLTQIAAWLFSVGTTESVSYRLARNPKEGASLLSSWAALIVPLTVLAMIAMELILPVLFAAQTDEMISLARIYVPVVGLMIAQAMLSGILLGSKDFIYYNLVRLITPGGVALAYVVFWATGHLTVEFALIINAAAVGFACLLGGARSLRLHGLGPLSRPLLRNTLWYGIRAHGGTIAGLVNARLDLLIVPAFLGAASVGLYSVATNVSSIIGTLTGTVAVIVLPIAASLREQSARTVIRTLHAVLLIGVAVAVPLELIADPALKLVYGSEFGDAATSLRILLPGAVLDAAALVLWSGLLAANRPFLSSIAAIPAAILTVVGLILFLESGGIEAAAIVSTTAYTVVFVISIVLYRQVAGLRWRDFVFAPP